MGIITQFKANKAYRIQQKGDEEQAIALYEACFNEGLNDVRYVLAYAMLLLRHKQFAKARDFLVKHQKDKGLTETYRTNIVVYYAACCFRMGEIDKGLDKLEQAFKKNPCGMLYQVLGYLYVEKYDQSRKADFLAQEAAKAAEPQEKEPVGALDKFYTPVDEDAAALTPEEKWQKGVQKTLDFNLAAVDYDDTDAVCLDNLAQTYYRVLDNKKEAKGWFDKAIAIKESQIDTLYFLSRYDLDAKNTAEALKKLEKAASGRFTPLNYCDKESIDAEIARLKGE